MCTVTRSSPPADAADRVRDDDVAEVRQAPLLRLVSRLNSEPAARRYFGLSVRQCARLRATQPSRLASSSSAAGPA